MTKKRIISTRNVSDDKVVVEHHEDESIPEEVQPSIPTEVESLSSSMTFKTPPEQLPSYQDKRLVVVIATWNCGPWIEDTFHSLAQQTLSDDKWGVLVVDDASDDGTAEICARWGVDYVRLRESRGKLHAFRIAAGMLDGDVIIVEVDADDAIEPDAVEVMDIAWLQTPDAVMIYSQYTCHNENWSFRDIGHNRESDLTIDGAGWISHLKTYRAKDFLEAQINESIRKSTDKEVIYRLQELAERTDREFRFINKPLYRYRRRAVGAITLMRELDATQARRNALKRRMGKAGVDLLTVYSASRGNDTGGPGIFWNRLMAGLREREDTVIVEEIRDSDVVIGNVVIPQTVDHQRPWVIRIDGIHFDSRRNYAKRNESITQSIVGAEGIVYQGQWGKDMADEYCGIAVGESTIISNGVDPPEGWEKQPFNHRPKIVACSRWGDEKYARRFKRLEETVLSFAKSGLAKKGYELVVLGQHYLNEDDWEALGYEGVTLADRVPSVEVWDYLSEAAAFLHLSWLDCCPNGVIEALAAKVPVIYCADGVSEIVGSAGARIMDSELNHPCDINKPPKLDVDVVAEVLREVVTWNLPDTEFPDVSMSACVAKYREFLGIVAEKGPLRWNAGERNKGPWKRIVASSDDMR